MSALDCYTVFPKQSKLEFVADSEAGSENILVRTTVAAGTGFKGIQRITGPQVTCIDLKLDILVQHVFKVAVQLESDLIVCLVATRSIGVFNILSGHHIHAGCSNSHFVTYLIIPAQLVHNKAFVQHIGPFGEVGAVIDIQSLENSNAVGTIQVNS